ncbi:DUF6710 family protein [Undibacterium sp. SXout11W]|uniref:DUF6710 family protein n=1 Tax=Undibacterium sp. SXout11W TaxID=3413050 RepID=UPI003BF07F21
MTCNFQRKRLEMQTEFKSLMEFASDLANENPKALADLVRMYLRPLQAEMIIDAVTKGQIKDVPSIDQRDFFWDRQHRLFDQLRRTIRHTKKIEIRLNRDVILPWPWERKRLLQALATIGTGKTQGRWKQDDMNHLVHVWLPWGIPFVGGGNHSIAAGIIAGEGKIVPTEIHDMSGIFKLVECDGMNFLDKKDGSIIAPVSDARVAAIFEIGRLMHKTKCSAW